MKILLRLFSKKFGYADECWDALSREERDEITLLFQKLLMHAEAHSIVIWHAGKNHAFEDGVEGWINFANMSINWGGYARRIRIQSLYDYFKYEYEGDAVDGGRLKSIVTASNNTFRGVTAFFEEGVSRETVDRFTSLDGTVSRKDSEGLCLEVVKGDEPMIEKGTKDTGGGAFFIISEATLKELFPDDSRKKKNERREKPNPILGRYSEEQRQNSPGSDRKQLGRLRKLVFSTDKDHIDMGVSLLASFNDPFLYDSLLQGFVMNRGSDICTPAPSPGTKVTAKETAFFNYAVTAILYHAGPDCIYANELKKDVRKLNIITISVSYLKCFPDLEHLTLSDSTGALTDLNGLDPTLPIKSIHLLDCIALRDISQLQRFPVTSFQIAKCPEVTSLSALKDKRDGDMVKTVWLADMDKLETLDGIEFYQGMEVLKIGNLKGLRDASALKKCPNFRYTEIEYYLNIPSCQSIEGLIGPHGKIMRIRLAGWGNPSFPVACETEELDIVCSGMQDLEWLSSFPRLRKMKINCDTLRDTRGLRFTPLLETLDIEDAAFNHLHLPESLDRLHQIRLAGCNQLKNLEDVKQLAGIDQVQVFYCTSLESIRGMTDNERLRGDGTLTLTDLPSLTALGSADFLDSLKRVEISEGFHAGLFDQLAGARNLDEIHFEGSYSNMTLNLATDAEWRAAFSASGCSIDVMKAPGIRRLTLHNCRITDFRKDINLSGIRELQLKECERLTSLDGLQDSRELEFLSIFKCKQLEDIDALQKLSQLKYLSLDGLASLKRISSIAYLENLNNLSIENCPDVEVSPRRKIQTQREDILKFRHILSEHYKTGLQQELENQLKEAKKSKPATVPEKEVRLIRKGLQKRDNHSIRKAVARLDALQDASLLDTLLDGILFQDKEMVPNPFFKGTAPAQKYLNTAMMGVLGVASKHIPRWREFAEGVSILQMQLSSIEYAGCFRNLVELDIKNLEAFPSPIDLPNLEFLTVGFYHGMSVEEKEIEEMRLEYLAPCKNLKSITIKRNTGPIDTLDFMLEFKNLENLILEDISTYNLKDLSGLSQCTRLKVLVLDLLTGLNHEVEGQLVSESSLDGLECCTELENLSIRDIPITDTKAIRDLKKIRRIHLYGLPIQQAILPEEAPVLEEITIKHCNDLSSISMGTCAENLVFRCEFTSLQELPIPRTAANIKYTCFYNNPQLASLDGFKHVKTIRDEKIQIWECPNIKDINGVSHIHNLTLEMDLPSLPQNIVPNLIIGLRLRTIHSLAGIGQFSMLTRLAISMVPEGFSLEALQELKSLQVLELEDNEHLLSLKGIAHLGHLQVLNLKNTPNLADISDLEKMTVDSIYTRGSKMKKADFPEHLQHKVIWCNTPQKSDQWFS